MAAAFIRTPSHDESSASDLVASESDLDNEIFSAGFPCDALPESVREVVYEICLNDKLAAPLAVQSVMTAISIACQDLVMIDRGIGTITACSLFMLAVADSGARKTRADRSITPSIENFDLEQISKHNAEINDYTSWFEMQNTKLRALNAAYTTQVKRTYSASDEIAMEAKFAIEKIENEIQTLKQELFERNKPKLKKLLYSSISIKELERCLCLNWPSAGIVSSEAADILNKRSESDMARLDRLWDGQGIDVVGRNEKESFSVHDPRLTMSLMVQPAVFDRFVESKGDLARGIGFIPRTLISRPGTPYGQRKANGSISRKTEKIDNFNKQILEILNHNNSDICNRQKNRTVLYFSELAQKLWESDHNKKEIDTVDDGAYYHEREFVNRYSEHVARIAALFHFFENFKKLKNLKDIDSEEKNLAISEHTLKSAIEIAEWYLLEFGRVFNPEKTIEEVANHVLLSLKKKLASKYKRNLDELQTLSFPLLSVPEGELRAFCTKHNLRKNKKLYMDALDWLHDKGKIHRFNDVNEWTKRTTPKVQLVLRFG